VVSVKRSYRLGKLWRSGCQEVKIGGHLRLVVVL
jgi:hypothetical protein